MMELKDALDTAIDVLSHGSSGKSEIQGVFIAMRDEIAKKPAAKKPAVKKPAAKKPAVKKPAAKKPA